MPPLSPAASWAASAPAAAPARAAASAAAFAWLAAMAASPTDATPTERAEAIERALIQNKIPDKVQILEWRKAPNECGGSSLHDGLPIAPHGKTEVA